MKAVLFSILFATALPAQSMTLNQATQSALSNSHELKIQKLELDSSKWNQAKAFSGFLPKIDFEAKHFIDNRFEELELEFGGSTVVMPAIYPYTSLGLTAKWNLFNGFRDTNYVLASRAGKTAAERNLERGVDEKRIQIRSLFSQALASQALVETINKNIEALQSHLHDINVRIHSGVSTRYDLLRGEVQLEEAQTEKLAAENAVIDSRAQLFEALGTSDDGKPLQGELSTEFTSLDTKKLINKYQTRSDRAVLIAQQERLNYLSRAARSHLLPAVSLIGNYEWYNNINKSTFEDDRRFKGAYAIGIELTWNLFDGGGLLADQKKAAIESQIAQEKLAKLDQSAPSDIEEIENRFNYDLANFKAKQSSVSKAEEAVRLARGELRAGTRTNSEILDAIVALNRARAASIKAQVEAINDMGKLELALGSKIN